MIACLLQQVTRTHLSASLSLLSACACNMSESRASREKKMMERFAPPAAKEDGAKHAIYEVYTGRSFFKPACSSNCVTEN